MVSVIIPTYNAATFLPSLFISLKDQTIKHELIIIDSSSTDGTQELVMKESATLINVSKNEFNHGATRNIGVKMAQCDILVFMTQDALPTSSETLETLVSALTSEANIAMAYGRQIPYSETGVFGTMSRLANYPSTSIIKTKALIPQLGIKTCSCSNSFAAYYKSDLEMIGGFPDNIILGEDVSVAARFILQDKAVAYSAEATVFHSHDYTLIEEFKRYFDIGVFHHSQRKILRSFSQAETEGVNYVLHEWEYLKHSGNTRLIPAQLLRTLTKYIGYKLGKQQNFIPNLLKRRISMHKSFWK